MTKEQRVALLMLLALGVITVAWWLLALWPVSGGDPEWLARTRAVCFQSSPNGLPGPGGWILLIGQPIGMFAALMVIWGGAVRGGLSAVTRGWAGRLAVAGVGLLFMAGGVAAGVRVSNARAAEVVFLADEVPPSTYPRLDRAAPPLSLTDQSGETLTLERFRGRPVFVTFAFGHCETICPMVVHASREAQETLSDLDIALVVVTVDPWRDTPDRLPYLATQWMLDEDGYALSGSVEDVQETLTDWNLGISRNPANGDVDHPAVVYIVDRQGRLAYAAGGGAKTLVDLTRRLDPASD